jgi:hypothetical protein
MSYRMLARSGLSHHWKAILFGSVALAAAFWIVGTSEAFRDCFKQTKSANHYQSLRENPSIVVRSVVRLDLNRVCIGQFANKDVGALSVLAAFIVALFTFTLWRSTDRLWIASERQREDARNAFRIDVAATKATLAISKTSADAALLTAKNLLRASRPLCVMESLRLGTFSGAVPDIELPKGYYLMSVYGAIANRGSAVAFARDLRLVSCIDDKVGEPLRPNDENDVPGDNPVFAFSEMPAGQIYIPTLPFQATPVNDEFDRKEFPLFVWGYLRYSDLHGIVRRSGFAFEWSFLTQSFHVCGGSGHWYDVEESEEVG